MSVETRNAQIDVLKDRLNTLVDEELERIDDQVAFLRRVRDGRGVGRLKSRSELGMRTLTENSIADFLAR